MNILYKKLYEIKKRPKMYLKRKSLSNLTTYIDGYMERQYEIDPNYEDDFSDFSNYVKQYYNANVSHRWNSIIDFYIIDEEEAFDEFYRLLEKYLKDYVKPEIVYPLGTTITKQECRSIKERHYTDHGNPKRCTNPHDHEIIWYPDNTFSYGPPINYHDNVPEF